VVVICYRLLWGELWQFVMGYCAVGYYVASDGNMSYSVASDSKKL